MAGYSLTKEYRRNYDFKRRYGITLEEYEELLLIQNGACRICEERVSNTKRTDRLMVDHCHDSLRVRGLLCHNCNALIGHAQDDVKRLRRAIKYLEIFDD